MAMCVNGCMDEGKLILSYNRGEGSPEEAETENQLHAQSHPSTLQEALTPSGKIEKEEHAWARSKPNYGIIAFHARADILGIS